MFKTLFVGDRIFQYLLILFFLSLRGRTLQNRQKNARLPCGRELRQTCCFNHCLLMGVPPTMSSNSKRVFIPSPDPPTKHYLFLHPNPPAPLNPRIKSQYISFNSHHASLSPPYASSKAPNTNHPQFTHSASLLHSMLSN